MKHKVTMLFFVLCFIGFQDAWSAADALAPQVINLDLDDDEDDDDLPEAQVFTASLAGVNTYGEHEARVLNTDAVRNAVHDLGLLQKEMYAASDDQVCDTFFIQENMRNGQLALQVMYDEYKKQKVLVDASVGSLFKHFFVASCGMYVRSIQSAVRLVHTKIKMRSVQASDLLSVLSLVDRIVQYIESLEERYFPGQNEMISQEVNQVIGLPVLGNIVLPVFAEYIHVIIQVSDTQLYQQKETVIAWVTILQWFVQENGNSLYAASQYQKLVQNAVPLVVQCIDRIVQYEIAQPKKTMQEYTKMFAQSVGMYEQVSLLATGLLDAQYYETAHHVQDRIYLIRTQIMPVMQKEMEIDAQIAQMRLYFLQNFSAQTVQKIITDLKDLIIQYADLIEILKQHKMTSLQAFIQEESLILSGDFCLALAMFYWHLFLEDKKDGFVLIHSLIQSPDQKVDVARIIHMCDAAQDVLAQDNHRYALSALYQEHDVETLLVYAYAFYVQAGNQDSSLFEKSSQALVSLEIMHAFKEVGQEWRKYFDAIEFAVRSVDAIQENVAPFVQALDDLIHITQRLKQAFGTDKEYVQQWFGMKDIQFDQWAVQLIVQVLLEKDFSKKDKIQYDYVHALDAYAGLMTDTQRRLLQRKSMQLEKYGSKKSEVKKIVSEKSVQIQAAKKDDKKVTVHTDAKANVSTDQALDSQKDATQNQGDVLYQQAEDASHKGKFYDSVKLYKQAVDEYTKLMHTEKDAKKLADIQKQLSLAQTRENALIPVANIVAFSPVFVAGMHVPSVYAELYSLISVSGDDIKMIPDSIIKNGVTKDTVKDFTDFLRKYCIYSQLKNKKINSAFVYKPNSLEHLPNLSDDVFAAVNAIEEAVNTYIEDVQKILTVGSIAANSTTTIPVEVTIKKSDKKIEFHAKNFPVALFSPLYPGGNAVATAFVSAVYLLQPGTEKIQINGQSFIPGNDPVLVQMLQSLLLHVYVYGAYEQEQQAQNMYASVKDQLAKAADVSAFVDQFTAWTDQYLQVFALLQGKSDCAQYYAQQVDAAQPPKISNSSLVQTYINAVFAEYISLAKTWLVGDSQSAGYQIILLKMNTIFDSVSGDQDASQAAQRAMAQVYQTSAQSTLQSAQAEKNDQSAIPLYASAAAYFMNAASLYNAVKDDVHEKQVMQLMYQCHLVQSAKLLSQYVNAHKNGISFTDSSGKTQTSTWQNMIVMSQIALIPGISGITKSSDANAWLGKVHDQYKDTVLQAALHIEAALSYYQSLMPDLTQSQYESLAEQVRAALVKNNIQIDETVAIDASQESVREEILGSIEKALPLFINNDQLMTVWIGSVYSCVAYAYLQDFLGGVTVPMDQDAFMKKWQDFVSAQQAFVQNVQNSSAAYVG